MELYSFRNVADAAFLFVALALAVASFLLITSTLVDHLRNYKYPALQTCCMRILLLAPIYALVSWCMMVFLPISSYIEILRDIYEAYSLYCFWVMLVLWCGGQRRVIEIVDRQDEAMGCYLCPLVRTCGCGLPVYHFRNSTNLFRYLRFAIMQLMLFKPLAGFVCAVLASSDSPSSRPDIKHLRILVMVSTGVAMHSIFTLYMATKPYMRGLNASPKFLSIKVVIAIILIQQFAINVLISADVIPEGNLGYTIQDHAKRIMCTVTIIEMAVFSLLLSYFFSHTSIGMPDGMGGSGGENDVGALVSADAAIGGGGVSAAATGSSVTDAAVSRRGSGTELFELVMGDASANASVRRGLPLKNADNVSLWSVFAMWDVVLMARVEEASMQCAAPGVPVELVDIDDTDSFLGSSTSLETVEPLVFVDMRQLQRSQPLHGPIISRPRLSSHPSGGS